MSISTINYDRDGYFVVNWVYKGERMWMKLQRFLSELSRAGRARGDIDNAPDSGVEHVNGIDHLFDKQVKVR